MRLENKVAFVTGGGSGLGRAVAERYAREGARVVVAEVNEAGGRETEESIRRNGGEGLFLQCDLNREDQVAAMVGVTKARFGRIDILHNNAAILLREAEGLLHTISSDVWDRTFQVNARGVFLVSKYVLAIMVEQQGGNVVMIGSPTAINGTGVEVPVYSASKGAVHGLTRALALQYAPFNIRVNLVIPGTMDTPMNATALRGNVQSFLDRIPLGRLGRPEDMAGISVFLASDDAAYCTGGVYTVDGGLTAY